MNRSEEQERIYRLMENINEDAIELQKQWHFEKCEEDARFDAGFRKKRKYNNAKRPKPRKKKR